MNFFNFFRKKKSTKTPLNKAEIISMEKRKNIAKRLKNKASEFGMDGLNYNEDEISGYFSGSPIDIDGESVDTQIHWRVNPFGNLEMASVIPTKMSDSHKYLSKFIDYDKVDKKNREDVISLCRQISKYEGIVSTALDVLTGLIPMSGWNITNVKNDDARKLCEIWCKNINGFNYSKSAIKGAPGIEGWVQNSHRIILRDGDYVGLKKWRSIEVPELSKKFNLPIEIESFDVLNLEWPKELREIKQRYFRAKLPDKVVQIADKGAKGDDEIEKIINDTLSKELKSQIKKYGGTPPLPNLFVIHLSRRSDGGDWGESYIIKTFGALAYKNRIRMLDNSTIAGLVQRIWIIKLGVENVEDDTYHVVSADRLSLAVNTFRQMKTQNILIWPGPDLKKEEFTTSDASVLSFDSRYKEADDDIYRALGVPRLLVEGQSTGNITRDSAIFLSLLSMLKNTLVIYEREISYILREIMEENGFKDEFPQFKFQQLSISDIQGYRSNSLRLYEDSLLGRKQTLRDHGYNPSEVIDEQIQEGTEKLNEQIPMPPLPFQGQGRPPGTADGDGQGTDNEPPTETTKRKNQENT